MIVRALYERLWQRDGPPGAVLGALSLALAPAELAYRSAISLRTWLYDAGLLKARAGKIPSLAVGNLTVGGTGKTPVTSWFAGQFTVLGHTTAVVMRGYGGDEVLVHQLLNPAVPVYVAADRSAGVGQAQAGGAAVAVLDDAFQHRGFRADASIVLIAAEEWNENPRLLPRGPWREPLSALRRATLIVTTRKVATREAADAVCSRLRELQPTTETAQAHIDLAGLARFDGERRRLGTTVSLQGFSAGLVVAGVARPDAVFRQLEEAGATIGERRAFSDHHRYSRAQVAEISEAAARGPLVATLKDAVKLGPVVDPGAEIYVPLQRVVWETGSDAVEQLVTRLSEKVRSDRERPA